jgi:protein SMG7
MCLKLHLSVFCCRLNVDGRNKLSVSEYGAVFLKLHGLLHNSSDLQEAEKYVKTLTTTLTAHVATESLTSWKLVQVLATRLCDAVLLGV